MNELHFTDQETHTERDYAAYPESQGDSMEELGVNQSFGPTIRHFHRVQSCVYFNFFFLIFIWLKKRFSET